MFNSVIDNNDHQRYSSQTALHGQRSLGNSHGSGILYPRSTQTIATQTAQVSEPIQPVYTARLLVRHSQFYC